MRFLAFASIFLLCLFAPVAGVAAGFVDCNENGIPDLFEIANGISEDCNENEVPDDCDLADGTSPDCDANTIPDECDTASTFAVDDFDPTIQFSIYLVDGDIDGDGDRDIGVVDQAVGSPMAWYENDGSGSFAKRVILANGEPGPLALSDIEGDGDLDIVSGYLSETVWFENTDGLGDFGPPTLIVDNGNDFVRSMAMIDIDADGDEDIVALQGDCAGPTKINWYENLNGTNAFGPAQLVHSSSISCNSLVHAADLDGDGDGDVLLTDGTVQWFENEDGTGAFGSSRIVGPGGWVRTADIDADGDEDLLAGQYWYENLDGAGNFGAPRAVTPLISYAYAADMDGDGDLDIVTGSLTDDILWWHENVDGQGEFGPQHEMYEGNVSGFGPVLFDFDGDGDMDAVNTRGGVGGVTQLENLSGDCNGDRIPDLCQPGCGANGLPDVCNLRSGSSEDCNRDLVPDECEISCLVDCDADADLCVDDYDCAPGDDTLWSPPTAARGLNLRVATEGTLLWNPPVETGAATVRYDTLRAENPADFAGATVCVESDGVDTSSEDLDTIPAETVYYYLIRVENDCPAGGESMGAASNGTPRSGRDCP